MDSVVRGAPGLLRLASGAVVCTCVGVPYRSAMGRNDRQCVEAVEEAKLLVSNLQSPF